MNSRKAFLVLSSVAKKTNPKFCKTKPDGHVLIFKVNYAREPVSLGRNEEAAFISYTETFK